MVMGLPLADGDAGELLAAIGELAGSIRGQMDLPAEALRELEAASFSPSSESIETLRFYNEGLRLDRLGGRRLYGFGGGRFDRLADHPQHMSCHAAVVVRAGVVALSLAGAEARCLGCH